MRQTPRTRRWNPTHVASAPTSYVERVNLAIDHVVNHLGKRGGGGILRLTDVARTAGLSPYHFHRVFQAMVGETLADFVRRIRLERALFMMATPPRGRVGQKGVRAGRSSLTSIALACGFSSSSDFSRSFKQHYGSAPSRFDIQSWRESHRAETDAAILNSPFLPSGSAASDRPHVNRFLLPAAAGGNRERDNPDGFKVRIRDLPARSVAYIRVRNPFEGDASARAVQRLMAWADRRGLADGQWLGYMWGKPEIVGLKHCVYHAAVEVPSQKFAPKGPLRVGGEIGLFRFPAMVVAQVEIRGDIHLETRAIRWLYGSWLPRSGYVPDEHPAFEVWIGRPFKHGMEYFELYAHLPVRWA